MTENKTITVTDDVWRCMTALEEVAGGMEEGDERAKAEAALSYLSALFKGETLPNIWCPGGGFLIR